MDTKDVINKILNSTNHHFITGKAGTGKSTLSREIIKVFGGLNLNIVVLAPTGVAALNIGGKTIHSFFAFPTGVIPQQARERGYKDRNKGLIGELFNNIDYMLIDEISMVRADMLDSIDLYLQSIRADYSPFGGVKMIFVGDLYQLSPIVEKNERDFYKKYTDPYFYSSYVFSKLGGLLSIINLQKVYRQSDERFVEALNNIRDGSYSRDDIRFLNKAGDHIFSDDHVILTSTNREKEEINKDKLRNLKGKSFISKIDYSGKVSLKETSFDPRLEVKIGSRVMFVKNNSHRGYYNGTLGEVIGINYDYKTIKIKVDSGDIISINKEDGEEIIYDFVYNKSLKKIERRIRGAFYQYPIILAWAMTIHKSQGKTFEKVALIKESKAFAEGQMYVALSRVRSFDGLYIKNPLTIGDILVKDTITDFLQNNFDSKGVLKIKENLLHLQAIKVGYFQTKKGIGYLEAAKKIIQKIQDAGGNAFIVGGFSRNLKLDIDVETDIDISTNLIPSNIKKYLDVVDVKGEHFGVLVAKQDGEVFEISTFREDISQEKVAFTRNFYIDAQRRDFTINALYYNPLSGEFATFHNAIGYQNELQDTFKDIQNRVIRFIGKPLDRIDEDPIRLLRYARFKAGYELKDAYESQYQIVKDNFHKLRGVPFERIKRELEKIFVFKNTDIALNMLKDLGFFGIFCTELDMMSDTPGGPHHHFEGNVWIHTLLVIKELSKYSKDVDLYWARLFHDVGKNTTYEKNSDGSVSYIGHEKVSRDVFIRYSYDFKFTKKQIKKISWLIENHMKFHRILDMRELKKRKLFLNPYFGDLYMLGVADTLGRKPRGYEMELGKIYSQYKNFIELYDINNYKILTGDDIMARYPELKGSQIRDRLEELNDRIILEM